MAEDFSQQDETVLRGFHAVLASAFNLIETGVDFTTAMPVTVMDMSAVLGNLIPVSQNPVFAARVPFLFTANAKFDSEFVHDVVRTLSALKTDTSPVVFLFPFVEQSDIEKQRDLLVQRIRKTGRDGVVIGRGDLLRILTSDEPARQLRSFALSQIDITKISPYITAGRIPDHIFFGRESDLREVTEHVADRSYAIIGGRRIGKTSMLHRLQRRYLPDRGFRAVYFDCSAIATRRKFLESRLSDWYPEAPPNAPATVGDLLETSSRDGLLVALLDEADKLVPSDRVSKKVPWPLFNALRSASNAGHLQFVFAGERSLSDAMRDSTGPLHNFTSKILLGPLDFQAVEDLITHPMRQLEIELVDQAAITQRIWEVTSGHPNVVQRLCHRLIERLNRMGIRRIQIGDVNAVIHDTVFLKDDFLATYLAQATVLEHLCTLLMATNPTLRTLSRVYEELNGQKIAATLNQTSGALERLVDLRNLLDSTADGYDFKVTAFPALLAANPRVADWIALRREIFLVAGDILPEKAPKELQGDLW